MTRNAGSVTATSTLIDDLARDSRSLHLYARRLLSGGADRLFLLIDQFEEVFTACKDVEERRAFIENLMDAAGPETAGPMLVVITLRADFYAHCSQFERLREVLARQQVYLGPLSVEELRQAITEPARRGGWELEPGLCELLLRAVGATHEGEPEPGALPLLSHALLETWKRREGRRLTLAGYHAAGGVRGALAQTAEAVYTHLSSEEQVLARSIFLRLTELGEGAQDTRRRATLKELTPDPECTPQVQTLLKTLADARLITIGEQDPDLTPEKLGAAEAQTVEVAHEALIREWPTLRTWLDEDREGLHLHRQLTRDVQEWVRLNRPADILYRGTRLARVTEWMEDHVEALNALERDFVIASQDAEARRAAEEEARQKRELARARELAEEQRKRAEAQQQRAEAQARFTRRLRIALVAAVLLMVLAIVAGMTALRQSQHAEDRRLEAEAARLESEREAYISRSRELASRSLAEYDPTGSLNLMLARESALLTWMTDGRVIRRSSVTNETLTALNSAVFNAQRLPWRMTIPWRTRHSGPVTSVAYSPDGTRIVSGSGDQTVRVWDAATGEQLHTLAGHTDWVTSVGYSPDGTRIVSGSGDQTVRQWYVDVDYLLELADSLIQRDPPIFLGQERALFGFDDWPAREH